MGVDRGGGRSERMAARCTVVVAVATVEASINVQATACQFWSSEQGWDGSGVEKVSSQDSKWARGQHQMADRTKEFEGLGLETV